jgi:hypothetical protein
VGDIRRGRRYSQRLGIFVEVGIFTGVGAIHRGLGYSRRTEILTEFGDIHSKPDIKSAFPVWN